VAFLHPSSSSCHDPFQIIQSVYLYVAYGDPLLPFLSLGQSGKSEPRAVWHNHCNCVNESAVEATRFVIDCNTL
jgi:hypothetical protein